jgi:hypothetical protein
MPGEVQHSAWSPDLAAAVVALVSEGKSLAEIALRPGMPTEGVVKGRRKADPAFAAALADARRDAADRLASECLRIADARDTDDPDDVAHRRLRIETRQRLARAWHPSTYGDQTRTTLAGDPAAPVVLSDADRAARIAAILASAGEQGAPALPAPDA